MLELLLACGSGNADVLLHVTVAPEFSEEFGDVTGALSVWRRGRQAVPELWDEMPAEEVGFVGIGEPLELGLPGGPVELVVAGDLSAHPTCEEPGCTESGWAGDVQLVVNGHGWRYPTDPEVEVNGTEVRAGSRTDIVVEVRASCECAD